MEGPLSEVHLYTVLYNTSAGGKEILNEHSEVCSSGSKRGLYNYSE